MRKLYLFFRGDQHLHWTQRKDRQEDVKRVAEAMQKGRRERSLHWTQREANRDKVMRVSRAMQHGRERKRELVR